MFAMYGGFSHASFYIIDFIGDFNTISFAIHMGLLR